MYQYIHFASSLILDLELDPDFYQEVKADAGISDEYSFQLEDFTYNISAITNRIFGYLQETDFLGITVSVCMQVFYLFLT